MGFTFAEILHRARRCEELGIGSLWLYDHMYGPGVPDIDSLEGWTLATALLSRTERLRVGHLVLCNQFRHPAVLAKMATTLDQISGGPAGTGVGSGSIEDEHRRMGLAWGSFVDRSERLRETLEILVQAFADERIDFSGTHYAVRDMPIKPGPVQRPRPPLIVGGSGRSTPCHWSRATPMSGTCRPTRWARWSTSLRSCDRCVSGSAATPPRS